MAYTEYITRTKEERNALIHLLSGKGYQPSTNRGGMCSVSVATTVDHAQAPLLIAFRHGELTLAGKDSCDEENRTKTLGTFIKEACAQL